MEDFGTLVQQFENAQKALYQRRETLLEEVEQIERMSHLVKKGEVLRNGDAYFAALRAIPLAGSGAA